MAKLGKVETDLIDSLRNMMDWARNLTDEQLDSVRDDFLADLKSAQAAIDQAHAMADFE